MKTNKHDILKNNINKDFHQKVSNDFTKLVMQKVEHSLANQTVIAPLISKRYWLVVLGVSFILIISSFGIETNLSAHHWMSDFSLPNLDDYKTSIQISISVFIILAILTVIDLLYRKQRQIT